MIDWEEIEKNCMSLDKDCVPQNAREWDVFIRQYENCLDYYEGRGHDFTSEGMTESKQQVLVNEHMYLGRGYKKSVFECLSDLNDDDKEIFDGLDWKAVLLVKRTWHNKNVYLHDLHLRSLPPCPRYVFGYFFCDANKLKSLKGAPKYVFGAFYCHRNKLTSLEGAPKWVGEDFDCAYNSLTSLDGAPVHVAGSFWCGGNKLASLEGAPRHVGETFGCRSGIAGVETNKLPASIPDTFAGKDLHKYVGLRESYVMRWGDFRRND
jgi:hypothetical protein